MLTTVDLRNWYLEGERPGGICNASALELPNLGTDLGDVFEATLHRVSSFTRARKANWFGLNGFVTMWPLAWVLPQAGI